MAEHDLESLYREAQSALKSRDYVRASELLRQILVIDENYKDVSRLLAQTVKLKRRRWYNHPILWSVIGLAIIVLLGFFIAPRLRGLYAIQPSAPVAVINSPIATLPPTISPTATATILPTPPSILLTWKRISIGQDFERDIVTAFATDKKDPDVIYAGLKNSGVYKTIDGGLSWRPTHQGLGSTQVESLFIDSQNPRILYAGTTGGVFKTKDGGENWHRIGDGAYLLMDMQNESHLYARDENGIYETTDQGDNWSTVYILKRDCPATILSWAIHPVDGSMLFLGCEDECGPGVYQSKDNGHSWKMIGASSIAPRSDSVGNLNVISIGLDEKGSHSIYTGNSITHDGGATWMATEAFGCNAFAIDPDNHKRIYCAYSQAGIMSIQGKGTNWRRLPGLESSKVVAIHVDHVNGAERIIAFGTRLEQRAEEGVFFSMDGGDTWLERAGGLGSTRAELRIDPIDNSRIYLASYYGHQKEIWVSCTLYRSPNNGKDWESIIKINSINTWCGPAIDKSGMLYLIRQNALDKSWDSGNNWMWITSDVSKWTQYFLPTESQSVAVNPYIDNFIYAVGDDVFYFADKEGLWTAGIGSMGVWDARLFFKDQGQTVYAVGRYHQAYSSDAGKTWQSCGEDIATSQSDSRLALDLQGSRLYLATPGQGVLVSDDKCQSWQTGNDGLSNLFVNTLASDPNNPDIVYAGTDGGAHISFDGGKTWGQVNDGLLGATVVYSIAVDKDSNVYAATPYGVFKLENK